MTRVGFHVQQLYGGALECSLPDTLSDASRFRQVPDHQEVFVSSSPREGVEEVSVIVELNQYHEGPADEFPQFVVDDLARFNEAQSCSIVSCTSVEGGLCIEAMMSVLKFDKPPAHDLAVLIGVKRVPQHSVDIQLVVYVPQGSEDLVQVRQVFEEIYRSLTVKDYNIFNC